jgi:hypothetical protein
MTRGGINPYMEPNPVGEVMGNLMGTMVIEALEKNAALHTSETVVVQGVCETMGNLVGGNLSPDAYFAGPVGK